MRVKYICVVDGEVSEIPFYKVKNGQFPKPEFANKTGIMMEMVYETRNRKPYKIYRVVFEHVTFDEQGIYNSRTSENQRKFCVKLKYLFTDLYEPLEPLPIPIAPIIPTDDEITALKDYINRKYPALLKNSPTIIEDRIAESKKNYAKELQKMKDSHREYRDRDR